MSFHEIRGADLLLHLRVQPRAQPEGIAEEHAGRLRVRIGAPPQEGRANARLLRLLADRMHLSLSRLALVRGEGAREKDVLIRGGGPEGAALLARLHGERR